MFNIEKKMAKIHQLAGASWSKNKTGPNSHNFKVSWKSGAGMSSGFRIKEITVVR